MSKDPTTPSRGPGDVKRIANRDIDELARFVRDGSFSYRVFAAEPSEGRSGRSLPPEQALHADGPRFSEGSRAIPANVAGAPAAAPTPAPSAEPMPVVDVNVPRGQLPHITFAPAPAVAPPPPPAVAPLPPVRPPETACAPRAPRKVAAARASTPSVREVLWGKTEPPSKPAPRPLLAGTVFAEPRAGEGNRSSAASSAARPVAARPDFSGASSVEQVLGSLMHPVPAPAAPSNKGSAGAVVEALFEYGRVR